MSRIVIFFLFLLALFAAALWPGVDLVVSGWFYDPARGFYLADQPAFLFMHWLAVKGAWALGILLGLLFLVTAIRRKAVLGCGAKSWLFLFLALIIGPVLIANVGLKDHWGRARPREVTEFGSTAKYSPPLSPQHAERTNESFVSGDGAFGFFLPCLAYVVPLGATRKSSRRVFWIGMGAGVLFGATRIAMGAHFFSDTVFACILMLGIGAWVHAAMYGFRQTVAYWENWFSQSGKN